MPRRVGRRLQIDEELRGGPSAIRRNPEKTLDGRNCVYTTAIWMRCEGAHSRCLERLAEFNCSEDAHNTGSLRASDRSASYGPNYFWAHYAPGALPRTRIVHARSMDKSLLKKASERNETLGR
ncbi:hypothetical protein HJFPF1_02725 [Paramyrothecium foliicola]|nr:hypothetical protein HJFPF1_02725 [Paramyrothecium foliicola]